MPIYRLKPKPAVEPQAASPPYGFMEALVQKTWKTVRKIKFQFGVKHVRKLLEIPPSDRSWITFMIKTFDILENRGLIKRANPGESPKLYIVTKQS